MKKFTLKEEKTIQEYFKNGGNKTAAYKSAYNTSKMKEETINVKACEFFKKDKIRVRVEELQKQIEEENKISKNKIITELLTTIMLDPTDLFNEEGELKQLEDIPIEKRRTISELGVKSVGGGEFAREVKFVKTLDKLKAIDMVNKMLGYYVPDRNETVVSESSELPEWFKGSKK